MSMADKPLDVLNKSLKSPVIVRIRGGREFRGILEGYDIHMNLLLSDAEEITDDFRRDARGEILIRGDNVVYVSPTLSPEREHSEELRGGSGDKAKRKREAGGKKGESSW